MRLPCPSESRGRKTRTALKCYSGTVGGVVDVSGDQAALTRLCERLRTASEPTLIRPREGLGGVSIAEAAYMLSQWAADAMGAPGARARLHPLASGDQLAVVGRDSLGGPSTTRSPGTRGVADRSAAAARRGRN